MKQLVFWWQQSNRSKTVSPQTGWPISAPFIVSIRFADRGYSSDPDSEARNWISLIDAVSRSATQIFIEGDDILTSAAAPKILDHLDAGGMCFHIDTKGILSNPSDVIHHLKSLKHLASLRFCIGAAIDDSAMPQLCRAVAAGITVWANVVADSARSLRDVVTRLSALGVAGFALRRSSGPIAAAVCEEAAFLCREGYRLVFDDCYSFLGSDDMPCRCSGGYGSCQIDGTGNVWVCGHDPEPLGSLHDASLEALWTAPGLQERRRKHAGHRNLCQPRLDEADARKQQVETATADGTAVAALDRALAPIACYRIRPEPFGAILINEFAFIAIAHDGARIAAAFDGTRSLEELERAFGPHATTLAFSLFCRKWLRFRRRSGEPRLTAIGDEAVLP